MILILHFFVGLSILTLIELEVIQLFDWMPGFGCRCGRTDRRGPVLIKDDDVIREEQRVAAQGSNRESMINAVEP